MTGTQPAEAEFDALFGEAADALEQQATAFKKASEPLDNNGLIDLLEAAELVAGEGDNEKAWAIVKVLAQMPTSVAGGAIADQADLLTEHGLLTTVWLSGGKVERTSAHHMFLDLVTRCRLAVENLNPDEVGDLVKGWTDIARSLKLRVKKERLNVLTALNELIRTARAQVSIPWAIPVKDDREQDNAGDPKQ